MEDNIVEAKEDSALEPTTTSGSNNVTEATHDKQQGNHKGNDKDKKEGGNTEGFGAPTMQLVRPLTQGKKLE